MAVRRFCASALLLAAGCIVNPPLAVGSCEVDSDCRPGRGCFRTACLDAGAVRFHFRQWADDFDRVQPIGATSVVFADGGVVTMQLPSGTSRGGYAQLVGEQLPLEAEGKIGGRVTFTSPTLTVDGTSVRLLNLDANNEASPQGFMFLAVQPDRELVVSGLVTGGLVTTGFLLEKKSYFIEVGWKLGGRLEVRVDGSSKLSVALDAGTFAPLFRARIGFQNYMPSASAAALSADFSAWQVSEGIDDVLEEP
jgi:hypothetical protein